MSKAKRFSLKMRLKQVSTQPTKRLSENARPLIKDRYTKAVQFLRLTVTSVLNGIGQVSTKELFWGNWSKFAEIRKC